MTTLLSRYKEFVEVRGPSNPIATVQLTLRDEGRWLGLRLEEWQAVGGDLDETVPLKDALVVTLPHPLGPGGISEMHWAGERRIVERQRPATLTLYPRGRAYTARGRGYWRGLVLAIDYGRMRETAIALGHASSVEMAPLHGLDSPLIVGAVQALADDVRGGYAQGPMYGEYVAAAVLAQLIKQNSRCRVPTENGVALGPGCRVRMEEFIEEQLDQDISLVDLAAFADTDVYSLSRWFRKTFGVPPHRFVLQKRMQRAQRMLLHTKAPLTEIALGCGFYSHSHFSTSFRRALGRSPTEFRRLATG